MFIHGCVNNQALVSSEKTKTKTKQKKKRVTFQQFSLSLFCSAAKNQADK